MTTLPVETAIHHLQLGTARINFKDPGLLDITAKSAATPIGKLLAPTWSMVAGVKKWQAINAPADQPINLNSFFDNATPLSWDDYVAEYYKLLRFRYADNRTAFISLLTGERAILACYCTDPSHCHRTLAADILCKIGVRCGLPVEFLGELK